MANGDAFEGNRGQPWADPWAFEGIRGQPWADLWAFEGSRGQSWALDFRCCWGKEEAVEVQGFITGARVTIQVSNSSGCRGAEVQGADLGYRVSVR